MHITGATAVYGIIGWPLHHSLSPLMQNGAFEAMGMDAVYVPFPLPPPILPEGVRGLAAAGVKGVNVTIPHKSAIIELLDSVEQSGLLAGAVNVVKNEEGRLVGYNTDGEGLLVSLRDDCGFQPEGKGVLLLGGGGAARGAVVALAAAGAQRIDVANRSIDRAREVVANVRHYFPSLECCAITLDKVVDPGRLAGIQLCLNTTSVGMAGDSFDEGLVQSLPADAVVYDMVYSPLKTPLLSQAAFRGLVCANGLGMLAAQGEAAFRIWTGTAPPAGLMKRHLLAAVGGDAA